ncbi:hypothetical protein BDZ89DRAFT_1124918 [Hymenopellis radicata]|nr:hypothetical protein BDZ89DRAFT_1124918 [Hymenopellis radicata]
MASSRHLVVRTYRSVLRELRNSSPKKTAVVTPLSSSFRLVLEQARDASPERVVERVKTAVSFLEAQRKYKELLDRYNPLVDLTSDERIHATARRVGLDMPVTHQPE